MLRSNSIASTELRRFNRTLSLRSNFVAPIELRCFKLLSNWTSYSLLLLRQSARFLDFWDRIHKTHTWSTSTLSFSIKNALPWRSSLWFFFTSFAKFGADSFCLSICFDGFESTSRFWCYLARFKMATQATFFNLFRRLSTCFYRLSSSFFLPLSRLVLTTLSVTSGSRRLFDFVFRADLVLTGLIQNGDRSHFRPLSTCFDDSQTAFFLTTLLSSFKSTCLTNLACFFAYWTSWVVLLGGNIAFH